MIDRSTRATGVLVGVDGHIGTLRAVAWAAVEAGCRHVPLDLVQVIPGPARAPELQAPLGRALMLLERARRAATESAPDVEMRLSTAVGVVGPTLVALAEQAQLLVVGAHATETGGDLAIGLGRGVMHALSHASCPVVAVPQHGGSATHDRGKAVVVGVDGSEEARGAVAFAADAADRCGVRLTAVTVAPPLGLDAEPAESRHLAEAVAGATARHPDVALEEVVRRGRPSVELLRAEGSAPGIIVLGSRGRGGVGRAVLGSTSRAVVRSAPCPVAVLNPAAARRWVDRERVHSQGGSRP